ncbi:ABCB family ABC transporter ATP-binding protein/permease [Marinicella sp. W31]|uniref:ABCB family ABC transporter ATP-binding protein/permease n=1 Tax=Marinicella sp. W31 TaxID=3023713 RepID=UPI003756CF91
MWPRDSAELKRRIVFSIVFMLGAKGINLVIPFLYKGAIDAISDKAEPLILTAIGLIGAYGLASFSAQAFQNIRDAIYVKVGMQAIRGITLDVFKHLHQLSLRFHLERKTGGISKIIDRGANSIDNMLYFIVFNIFPTIFELVLVCIIFAVQFGWEVVSITLVCVVLYIVFTSIVTEWRTRLRRAMVEKDTAANSRAIDSLLNYETVKYFGNEAYEIKQYDAALQRYAAAATKSESSMALLNIGQALITNLCMVGTMVWVTWEMQSAGYSVGDLVLVNTFLMQLFRPLHMLGWVYREIKQGLVDMEMIFNLIDEYPEVSDAADAQPIHIEGATVTFDNVEFCYESDRKILHGISFHVPAGHTLAVVGDSGAGKSTLSRILYRFYDISSGQVLIDGQSIDQVSQSSLRAAIGIVPQDTVLFNDSIAYNIAYGRPGASEEAVMAAAKKAAIHDFIMQLPKGYETVVGERGLKLSGGEKQRVAIARTILKDPPILIFDEATSALDTKTERNIQNALNEVAADRTTIMIAHRLSTVVDADDIIVLKDGNIVEQGSHRDLLAVQGQYAAMWAQQQQAMAKNSVVDQL